MAGNDYVATRYELKMWRYSHGTVSRKEKMWAAVEEEYRLRHVLNGGLMSDSYDKWGLSDEELARLGIWTKPILNSEGEIIRTSWLYWIGFEDLSEVKTCRDSVLWDKTGGVCTEALVINNDLIPCRDQEYTSPTLSPTGIAVVCRAHWNLDDLYMEYRADEVDQGNESYLKMPWGITVKNMAEAREKMYKPASYCPWCAANGEYCETMPVKFGGKVKNGAMCM